VTKMKRVYVAGAYSASDVVTVLDNMREGMRLATEVFLAGFAPFCPHLDYHYQLMLQGHEQLVVDDYYRYSMAWLEAADAVLVGQWRLRTSHGTRKEIHRAKELGIPVFYSIKDLIEWGGGNDL